MAIDITKYKAAIDAVKPVDYLGHISQIVGLTIQSKGPQVSIGEICKIQTPDREVETEVVGFKDSHVLLMPLSDMQGIGPGQLVYATGEILSVKVGPQLMGRALNGLGKPMDGKPDLESDELYPVQNDPPSPLSRKRIREPLSMGVKVIDGLLTIGKGQRVGIFAGSGVGKSTLLGMIARNTKADINVIALIGERGREVKEFIEKDLKEEGLARSVVITATSDQPALVRVKAAFLATAIAEYFRDQGRDVMLMMDSLTRFSMAQREIGLATGEPPVSRGYTPSVFSMMPKLLERAGNSDKGSITGLYTVLVDGDDLTEPITDTARGILDGHIVLSRKIANKNHYPAIDVLASISRVMGDVTTMEHRQTAGHIKGLLATYKEAEDLINIGAYVKGSNKDIDLAVSKIDKINQFLRQRTEENISFEDTIKMMEEIAGVESN
ncbi:MAG: flagellar protein export ATPase FliI [Clostridia bacterium]|nr:flagellar protein export ATPase FliI [Clostridia bacterium]